VVVVEAADEAADEAGETAVAAGADAAISPVEVAVGVVILPDAGVVELVLAVEVDLGMMLSLLAARAPGEVAAAQIFDSPTAAKVGVDDLR
jgi:hypothetical protein